MEYKLSRETYDLYCSLLSSAVKSHRSGSILTPFPMYFMKNSKKDFDHLKKTLSEMPQSDQLFKKQNEMIFSDMNNLVEKIREWIETNWKDKYEECNLDDIVALMEFIMKKQSNKKFSVHYISYQEYLKKNPKLLMKPDHIFELKYNSDEFDRKSNDFYTGFHGSSIENFFSIITNSLQNYSDTELMRTGNAFGNGIYLCEDVRVARDFSKGAVIDWKNTTLGSYLSAVVQCKVVGKPHYALKGQQESNEKNRYLIVNRSEDVRIQYVLLFSHFKNEKELESSRKFSYGMIYVYIILLLALIIGNYWKDIKRELKRYN